MLGKERKLAYQIHFERGGNGEATQASTFQEGIFQNGNVFVEVRYTRIGMKNRRKSNRK